MMTQRMLRPVLLPALLPALLGAGLLAGCMNRSSQQNDEQLRDRSAQATRDVRKGAKELAAEGKVAAANAVDGVNAIAKGVKDGSHGAGGDPITEPVDINHASTARLAMLPGISVSKANDIVKGRPWSNAHALVRRGLLTSEQYSKIESKVTAK